MGLSIKCPFCGGEAAIRTSERPSLLSVQAKLQCNRCGDFKGDFIGQIINVKRAVFVDCPEVNQWDKSENEYLKEKGLKKKSNEEHLADLKGQAVKEAKQQLSFFERELPPEREDKQPLTRMEKRAKVARH